MGADTVTTDTSRDHDDAVESPKQQAAASDGHGVKLPPSSHGEKQIGVAKVEAIASLWSRNHLIVAYVKSVHNPPHAVASL
jgi:ribosomal protein L10